MHPARRDRRGTALRPGDGGPRPARGAGRVPALVAGRRQRPGCRHIREGVEPSPRDRHPPRAADRWSRPQRRNLVAAVARAFRLSWSARGGTLPWARRVPGKAPGCSTKLEQLRTLLGEISDLGRAAGPAGLGRAHQDARGRGAGPAPSSWRPWRGSPMSVSSPTSSGGWSMLAAVRGRGLAVRLDEASLVQGARRTGRRPGGCPPSCGPRSTGSASLAEHAWVGPGSARTSRLSAPPGEERRASKRRYVECFEGFDDFEHPYDALLDDFEPGMRTAEWRGARGAARRRSARWSPRSPPRTRSTTRACTASSRSPLRQALARDVVGGAAARGRCLAARLPRPPVRDRDLARRHPDHHPLRPGYIGTALWSVVHEAGHAPVRERGARRARRGRRCAPRRRWGSTSPRAACGRTGWAAGARTSSDSMPRLRELFPEQFGNVDTETLYRAANRVRPVADSGRGRSGHLQPPRRDALRARARDLRGAAGAR